VRVGYLVTLCLEKDGKTETPYEMSILIRGALYGLLPATQAQVYVATSDLQPDDTKRKTFLIYLTMGSLNMSLIRDLQNALRIALPGRDGFVSIAPQTLQTEESRRLLP
jgi:hypothetical protein